MFPLVYGAYALAGIYSAGKLYDTGRYWYDYKRRTGYSPRYPFVHGWGDTIGYAAGSMGSFSGLANFDGYRPGRMNYDYMYG